MATTATKKTVEPKEVLEQLLSDICHQAHKHEVQYWLDAPGTDSEKLGNVLKLAREALHLVRHPEDCRP